MVITKEGKHQSSGDVASGKLFTPKQDATAKEFLGSTTRRVVAVMKTFMQSAGHSIDTLPSDPQLKDWLVEKPKQKGEEAKYGRCNSKRLEKYCGSDTGQPRKLVCQRRRRHRHFNSIARTGDKASFKEVLVHNGESPSKIF